MNQIIVKENNKIFLKEKWFNLLKTSELDSIVRCIEDQGFEIRLVGGSVRDILTGRIPKDLDLATNALPEKVKKCLESSQIKCIDTGLQHGTVTAHINGKNFEITTLRIDEKTDGRHACVQFINDWELDAKRRDLTINSISLSYKDGQIFDYFNGIEDLENKKIIFVGDPIKRIKEDHLRILRYFRFWGKIISDPVLNSYKVELTYKDIKIFHSTDALDAIEKNVDGLNNISSERVWAELSKILNSYLSYYVLKTMIQLKVLQTVLKRPQSYNFEEEMKELFLLCTKYYDSSAYNDNITGLHAASILASFCVKNEDIDHFYSVLRLSKREYGLCSFIMTHRNKYRYHDNPQMFYKQLLMCDYNIQESNDQLFRTKQLILYDGNIESMFIFDEWEIPIFPINGKDIVEMGYKGKDISKKINELKKYWIESEFYLQKIIFVK